MRKVAVAASLFAATSALWATGLAQGKRVDLREAWRAWEDGDIARAHALAQGVLVANAGSDEARHVLVLIACVTGRYRDALEHYRSMSPGYRRLKELTDPVIEAYVHLGAVGDAAAFARSRKEVAAVTVQRLDDHSRRPFRVDLPGVAVVPFTDHPLSDYLPAFSAEINGQAVVAHVDTGGAFLHMGPDRARALGIRTVPQGVVRAHLDSQRVGTSYGIAERLALGGAVLQNVPVEVLSTLTGDSDLVIFGTNLLEQFLATLDYPQRRLVLSRRGNAAAAAAHRAMLPSESVTVPFHLWADHYMFARGGLGARHHLNFFVDSGLVSLHPDGKGGTRQASFTSSKRRLKALGIPAADINRGVFELPGRLALGPLSEDRPLVVVGAAGDQNFGGVRIDGLISHAFLKRYVWTIDFDAHEYRFTARETSPRG